MHVVVSGVPVAGFNWEQLLASLGVSVSPSEKQILSESCGQYWTSTQMPAQPLPGCVTSGSSFTSLCLCVSSLRGCGIPKGGHRQRLGSGTLNAKSKGLDPSPRTWGATQGLWEPQGLGVANWSQAPVFCHILLLNHMGGAGLLLSVLGFRQGGGSANSPPQMLGK